LKQPPLPYSEYRELTASASLAEGQTFRFDIERNDGRQPLPCFLVRKRGKLYGFLNRCMHWPVTLDMETNDFWDYHERYIQCKTHGALYELTNGECIAGPCTGERLIALPVFEQAGKIVLDMTRLPVELASE
jgi:nitrite reductase/ring-hydroxylating ferredoxin subunit